MSFKDSILITILVILELLFTYDVKSKEFLSTQETDFKSNEIMERKDIEKWVMAFPEILGEDLLIISAEYNKFDRTKDRLDLLAIDKKGKLAIIELKRDDSGKSVELQAVKYAAYCSTMTFSDLIPLRKSYLSKNGIQKTNEEVEKELYEFIDNDDFEELDDKPRIILVARNFRPEVTSSVLWLRRFNVDLSCVKLTPYKISKDKIALVSSKLIPLPEAEEYIIRSEKKESAMFTRSQLEYLEFYQNLVHGLRQKTSMPLADAKPQSIYQIPTGISGVHFEWAFHGRPRSSFAVELHFEKADKDANLKLLKEIEKSKDEIEKETGEKVIFQEDWGKVWARLYIEKNEGKMTDELKEWAIEKMAKLQKLLWPKLDKLKAEKF